MDLPSQILVVAIVAAVGAVFLTIEILAKRKWFRAFTAWRWYEMLPYPVVAIDRGGTIRSLNQAAHDTFGYDEQEILGQPIAKLLRGATVFHPPAPGAKGSPTIPMAAGCAIDTDAARRNGTHFRARCLALRCSLRRMFLLIEDTSDRQSVDHNPGRSELVTRVLGSLQTPLMIVSATDRVLFFNHACQTIFGSWLAPGQTLQELGIVQDNSIQARPKGARIAFECAPGYVFSAVPETSGLWQNAMVLVGVRRTETGREAFVAQVRRLEDLITELNGYAELLLCSVDGDSPHREDIEHLCRLSQDAIAALNCLVAEKVRQHGTPA